MFLFQPLVISFGAICFSLSVTKDGQCPAVQPGTVGICSEECGNDAHCPGTKKCCSNGCGHVCIDAEEGELFK